jgi:hypothetical protein
MTKTKYHLLKFKIHTHTHTHTYIRYMQYERATRVFEQNEQLSNKTTHLDERLFKSD